MEPMSTFDFSSILNAGKKADPGLGSLGTFGGVSDPFASNPYLFNSGATNFAQAGFTGSQLGTSLFGNAGLGGALGGQADMMQLLALVQSQQKALDQYIQLDNVDPDPDLKAKAQKISETEETVSTKDEAEKINKAGEDVATKDEAKKISDTKD